MGIATFQNIREIQDSLRSFVREVDTCLIDETYDLARRINAGIQAEVPRKSGTLAGNSKAAVGRRKVIKVSSNAKNKKDNYNYAPIQHENLKYNHKVGKAKFVEDPLRRESEDFMQRVRSRIMK
jgi:hypothetical protein